MSYPRHIPKSIFLKNKDVFSTQKKKTKKSLASNSCVSHGSHAFQIPRPSPFSRPSTPAGQDHVAGDASWWEASRTRCPGPWCGNEDKRPSLAEGPNCSTWKAWSSQASSGGGFFWSKLLEVNRSYGNHLRSNPSGPGELTVDGSVAALLPCWEWLQPTMESALR